MQWDISFFRCLISDKVGTVDSRERTEESINGTEKIGVHKKKKENIRPSLPKT